MKVAAKDVIMPERKLPFDRLEAPTAKIVLTCRSAPANIAAG